MRGGVDEDVSKNDGVRLCCRTRSAEMCSAAKIYNINDSMLASIAKYPIGFEIKICKTRSKRKTGCRPSRIYDVGEILAKRYGHFAIKASIYEEPKERNVRKCIQEPDGHIAKSFLSELKQRTILMIFIAKWSRK